MNADHVNWNEQLLELNRGDADSVRLPEELEASLDCRVRSFLDGARSALSRAAETKAAIVPEPVEGAGGREVVKPEPVAEISCCHACGNGISRGVKFCGNCGAPTGRTGDSTLPEPACGACGRSLSPGAKFCGACGQTVAT